MKDIILGVLVGVKYLSAVNEKVIMNYHWAMGTPEKVVVVITRHLEKPKV